MGFFTLVVASLATFRLALLVTREHGPMRLFDRLRKVPPPHSNARKGLECPWCMSVWIAAAVTLFVWWRTPFPASDLPLYWLAVSAGSILFHQVAIAQK